MKVPELILKSNLVSNNPDHSICPKSFLPAQQRLQDLNWYEGDQIQVAVSQFLSGFKPDHTRSPQQILCWFCVNVNTPIITTGITNELLISVQYQNLPESSVSWSPRWRVPAERCVSHCR